MCGRDDTGVSGSLAGLAESADSPLFESPCHLRLQGEPHLGDLVEDVGRQVFDIVYGVPGMVEIQSSDRVGKPEINILPRRRHLAEQGLVASQLGGLLRAAYEGEDAGAS